MRSGVKKRVPGASALLTAQTPCVSMPPVPANNLIHSRTVIPSAARNLLTPSHPCLHRPAQLNRRFSANAKDSSLGLTASL